MLFDSILAGGTVYDGSGAPGFAADVGIREGRITVLGDLSEAEAGERLDASGLAVAPGFVDLHTHSDFTLVVNGRAESQVHQGVTTEAVGQCGHSCAPLRAREDIARVAIGYVQGSEGTGWKSFDEYLSHLEQRPLGVNVAAFVGHGAVHRAVLGDAMRAPEPDEVDAMADLVRESLEAGAAGFSTGLEYWPGSLASIEHIVPLCKAASDADALYATHVRNRDYYYDLGFGEALATARQAQAKLQISHIQPKFGAPPHAMEHTLEMVRDAGRREVDVAFDVIPHDWSHTLVMAILPQWALEGGVERTLVRLADPAARVRIKRNPRPIWQLVAAGRWSDIVLLHSNQNPQLIGTTFAEIGKLRSVDPYDAVFDLLLEEGDEMAQMMWTSQSFSEDDIKLCLEQSECAVISDTLALAPYGDLAEQLGSLSGYGWAPRFLRRYVAEQSVLDLPEAVRRLTSLPAARLGLRDRGAIRPGAWADITVFDPERIAEGWSIAEPRVYPSGIEHVFVNGRAAVRGGRRTEADGGMVLRRSGVLQ